MSRFHLEHSKVLDPVHEKMVLLLLASQFMDSITDGQSFSWPVKINPIAWQSIVTIGTIHLHADKAVVSQCFLLHFYRDPPECLGLQKCRVWISEMRTNPQCPINQQHLGAKKYISLHFFWFVLEYHWIRLSVCLPVCLNCFMFVYVY